MKNKNIYIIAGVVLVILIIIFSIKSKDAVAPTEESGDQTENVSGAPNIGTKSTQTSKTEQKSTAKLPSTIPDTTSSLPDIDFINERISFGLKDFPGLKLTINKVAFGRGDTAISTGCSGIPNANFSTYLYPGSGICIGTAEVDGSQRGIMAFHILVENSGNAGFGGNSDTLKLHYLRADSAGKPVYRFAYPIMGLASYYINGYSSKEIILSYLVPEDQLVYNFVYGYKEPPIEDKGLNVYDFSVNGLLVDFIAKDIKIVK